MAISPSSLNAQPIPIPLDLRQELPDPWTPWRISDRLFKGMEGSKNSYKKIEVLPTDPEWRFVSRYFHHNKPIHYGLRRICCIHERHQTQAFESSLSRIELEASKFPPKWEQEPRADQRATANKRWEMIAQTFSPFKTAESDGRQRAWENVKVLPLWHGTCESVCHSISESGFAFFGKTNLGSHQTGDPKNTDQGYFGSGIYFTTSARYAAEVYSKGHLMLAWVLMRNPFPIVGDPAQTDMKKFLGQGAFKDYGAHYIPVVPADNLPNCTKYYPCQKGEEPIYDELVIFQYTEALPRFWIELEVEPLYLQKMSETPRFVKQLIPHLIKILQNASVDGNMRLRNILYQRLEVLLKLKEDAYLEEEHKQLFNTLTQLILPSGELDQLTLKRLTDSFASGSSNTTPVALSLSTAASNTSSSPSLSLRHTPSVPKNVTFYEMMTDKTIKIDKLETVPIAEFIAAIDKEPRQAVLYCNLARIMESEQIVTLLKGPFRTKQQLCKKAIDLDPKYSFAYFCLATTLKAGASTRLIDGTSMTLQQLCLKAIDLDPNHPAAYYLLAVNLTVEGIVTIDGTSMKKQELFLKVIDLDPNFSKAYYNLAVDLTAGDSIELIDGTFMSERELYLKAIDLDPNFSNAYFNLAVDLAAGDTVDLLNGTSMTDQELYRKAIHLNPNHSWAYVKLANALDDGDDIKRSDKTSKTQQQQLYLKAIELDPKLSYTYIYLANTLVANAGINLSNGKLMTQQELYLKAIDLNPDYSLAYCNLANTLNDGVPIGLLNGTSMTKQELYLNAIDLDPNFSTAYNNLARTLSNTDRVELINGTSMTKQKLLLKVIDLDPNCFSAYYNLAVDLTAENSNRNSIELLNRTSMTQQELFLKVIDLKSDFLRAYDGLLNTMSVFQFSIKLLNGTSIKKSQLYSMTEDLYKTR